MSNTLTIRNLDDGLKARLRLQAAQHGHSMEQEVREILGRALQPAADAGLAQRIQARFAGLNADALPIPARRPARKPDVPDVMASAMHEPAAPAYRSTPAAGAPTGTKPSTARRRR
jgi:plasmid stability protein